jgi:5'-nucleotidase
VPILASNTVFSSASTEDDNLEQFKTAGLIRTKLVKTLDNGVKVGIFGVMGADSPMAAPVTFDDVKTVAKQLVAELRQQDQVDLVICLSHTGVDATGSGPDAELAAEVPGIDVIVSGHTHVALAQPKQDSTNKTLIVQAGHSGEHLGKLVLRLQEGQVSLKSYQLLTIDDAEAGDAKVQQTVDGWIQTLDAMLQPAGLSYAQVVAETNFDLTIPPLQESILGNVITDSYRTVVDALEPSEQVVLAFEANGLIRDPVHQGKTGQLGFADLYRAISLGAGPDGEPGYPLVTFYLTGPELKMGLELTANAADVVGNDYFLQVSGVQLTYDKAGLPFNRVTSVKKSDGTAIDLGDSTTCHKVATNYYLAAALPALKQLTAGAIDITPRAKDCTPVADITARIVDRDPTTPGLQELKSWQALVQYLSQMPDADGDTIPDLPAPYAQLQLRITAK